MPVSRVLAAGLGDALRAPFAPFTADVLAWATAQLRADAPGGNPAALTRQLTRAYARAQQAHLANVSTAARDALLRAWLAGAQAAAVDLNGTGFDPDAAGDLDAVAAFVTGHGSRSFMQLREIVPGLEVVRERVRDLTRSLEDAAMATRSTVEHALGEVGAAARSGPERARAGATTWDAYLARGLRTPGDEFGRTWNLADYAASTVDAMVGATVLDAYVHVLETAGAAYVTVSRSVADCPRCDPWEGARLALADPGTDPGGAPAVVGTLVEARAKGLFHPHCRHRAHVWTPDRPLIPAGDGRTPAAAAAERDERALTRRLTSFERRKTYALDPALGDRVAAAAAAARAELAALRTSAVGAGSAPGAPAPVSGSLQGQVLPDGPGHWTVSAADLAQPYPDDARRDAVRALFEATPLDVPGFGRLTCDLVNVTVRGDGVAVEGRLYDRDGAVVARFDRSIFVEDHLLQAGHNSLTVADAFRGNGVAAAFNGRLFNWYRDSGVDAVTVSTTDIGGYAWARAGFDFLTEDDADKIIGRLNEQRRAWNRYAAPLRRAAREGTLTDIEAAGLAWIEAQLDDADVVLDRAEAHTFGTPGFPTAYDIASIGRARPAPEGRTDAIFEQHLGKAAMVGANWDGIKYLNSGSATAADTTDSDAAPATDADTETRDSNEHGREAPDRITVPLGQMLTGPGGATADRERTAAAARAARDFAAVHPDAVHRFTPAFTRADTDATWVSFHMLDPTGDRVGYAIFTVRGTPDAPVLEVSSASGPAAVWDTATEFASMWRATVDTEPVLAAHPSAAVAGGQLDRAVLRRVRQAVTDAVDAFNDNESFTADHQVTLFRSTLAVSPSRTVMDIDVTDTNDDDDDLGTFTVNVDADGVTVTDVAPAHPFNDAVADAAVAFAAAWNRAPVVTVDVTEPDRARLLVDLAAFTNASGDQSHAAANEAATQMARAFNTADAAPFTVVYQFTSEGEPGVLAHFTVTPEHETGTLATFAISIAGSERWGHQVGLDYLDVRDTADPAAVDAAVHRFADAWRASAAAPTAGVEPVDVGSHLLAPGVPLSVIRAGVADVFERGAWNGFNVEVASINRVGDTVTVRGDIVVDGATAGTFTRSFRARGDRVDVGHDYLYLLPEYHGRGIATGFNRHLFGWYRRSGFRSVTVLAALEAGGYAWARAGYDWVAERDALPMWELLRETAPRYQALADDLRTRAAGHANPGTAAQLRTAADTIAAQARDAFALLERVDATVWGAPDYPTPKDLSEVGMPPDRARTGRWLGKDVLLSHQWYGVQWLDGEGDV
ncbi:phage minor capsid protein [Glycomyces sp. A-F 0318]|uniref:phage minor capsid protein n=1 Tax=Glycomyces amatae TaxID=2881355 RepID=UPI001E3B80A0|nr:phage minor capsid protein [Glycomyces amatae]MCD0446470.1 phage minor capsid protein [Glycomyces amatae]